ncbi:MAG TPA: hypothetical protein VHQ39_06810, partial [Dongiaceae bacterium]|nr:hypothetical protein [Dongiaceae bacterium]
MVKSLYKPRPAGTLKAAIARLVERAGGVNKAADLASRSRSQMQRYTDDAEPDMMPVDAVRTLETAVGETIVSGFLVREQGGVVLHLPRGAAGTELNIDFARIGERTSTLFAEYGRALKDGKVSAKESGRLLRDLDEVLTAGCVMRARLQAGREEGG